MTWIETLRTGLAAMRAHSMRSTLTVLGILIGIAAVILTVGLGLGTQKDVSAQISALGSNLLIVTPGSSTSASGMRGGFGSSATLTRADAKALVSEVNAPDIAGVAAEKSSSLSLETSSTNWTTTVTGTTEDWLAVRSRELASGLVKGDKVVLADLSQGLVSQDRSATDSGLTGLGGTIDRQMPAGGPSRVPPGS